MIIFRRGSQDKCSGEQARTGGARRILCSLNERWLIIEKKTLGQGGFGYGGVGEGSGTEERGVWVWVGKKENQTTTETKRDPGRQHGTQPAAHRTAQPEREEVAAHRRVRERVSVIPCARCARPALARAAPAQSLRALRPPRALRGCAPLDTQDRCEWWTTHDSTLACLAFFRAFAMSFIWCE